MPFDSFSTTFSSSIGVQLSFINIIINLIVASLLGWAIAWVYAKTHRGLSFSSSFVATLVLTTTISAVVMMVIGNNLARAFGLVGAFSIIRFRTAVKEIKDMAFIFLSVVVGMAVGNNSYLLAASGAAAVLLLAALSEKAPFPISSEPWYILSLRYKSADLSPLEKIIENHAGEYIILTMTSAGKRNGIDALYHVRFRKDSKPETLLQKLRAVSQVNNPQLSAERTQANY